MGISDHFRAQVAEDGTNRLLHPTPEDLQGLLSREHGLDCAVDMETGDNFCLFVDRLCLESLDEFPGGQVSLPAVGPSGTPREELCDPS